MSDLITKAEIAPLLGISGRQVRNHVSRGTFAPEASGFFNRAAVVGAYTQFLEAFKHRRGLKDISVPRASSGDDTSEVDAEELRSRIRKTRAALKKDQNKLAAILEETVERQGFEESYGIYRDVVLAELATLPHAIATSCEGQKDISVVGGIITDEGRACLSRIRKALDALPVEAGRDAIYDTGSGDEDLYVQLSKTKTARNNCQAALFEVQASLFRGDALLISDTDRVMGQRISNARSRILSLASGLARQIRGISRDNIIAEVSSSVADIAKEWPEFVVADFRTTSVLQFAQESQENDETE